MPCRIFGAKPLSGPMLADHQWHPWEQLSQNTSIFIQDNEFENEFVNVVCKKVSHFVSASMSYIVIFGIFQMKKIVKLIINQNVNKSVIIKTLPRNMHTIWSLLYLLGFGAGSHLSISIRMTSQALDLTHWPLGDLSMYSLNLVNFKLISAINISSIFCEIDFRWMPQDLTDHQPTLVQVMAWCRPATSYYLSQCWHRSLSPYGVTNHAIFIKLAKQPWKCVNKLTMHPETDDVAPTKHQQNKEQQNHVFIFWDML